MRLVLVEGMSDDYRPQFGGMVPIDYAEWAMARGLRFGPLRDDQYMWNRPVTVESAREDYGVRVP